MNNIIKKELSVVIFVSMLFSYTSVYANPATGADGEGTGNGDLTGDGLVVSNLRADLSVPQLYPSFEVETRNDIFVNAEVFMEHIEGILFEDKDADGIVDVAQNSPAFAALQIGAFIDTNHDSIHDVFQSYKFYQDFQITNFVDVDSDGLCDNYERDPWAEFTADDVEVNNLRDDVLSPQLYPLFVVDTSEDIFINPEIFDAQIIGISFVDENEDGVVDVAQDSAAFAALEIGPFIDLNRDKIYDVFQSYKFYQDFQIANFIDVDSDGLCDNYEREPWAE